MTNQSPTIICLALFVVAIVESGCGASRIAATSAEDGYRKGAAYFERGRYSRAAEQLLTVFDFGRAHEWAPDAQFMLAEAYQNSGQYLLAANEFDRFSQLYSGDPRVEEAHFKRAVSYYHLSPTYELDQKDTEQAITYLRLYASMFPQGAHLEEAGKMIDELQSKLAHKLFAAAELYERQRQYESAALTFERVLDQYPNTEWAPKAMLGAIRAYLLYADFSIESLRPERLDKAIQTYERLIQIFPDDPVLKEAELLYERAIDGKQRLETPGGSDPDPISG
jgi:outer membrane protein assembly factor BamD